MVRMLGAVTSTNIGVCRLEKPYPPWDESHRRYLGYHANLRSTLRGCLKSPPSEEYPGEMPESINSGKCYETDLNEAAWRLIEPMLPAPRPGGRPRTTDLRAVLNAIFYLLRTGCQW